MKKQKEENFLLRTPLRKEGLKFEVDEKGIVTLLIENKGFFNRLFQKILKKPKVTHIHLDEMGSFIWPLLDGEDNLISLGEKVKEHFGDKAEPLYERLARYIKTLESYKFIEFTD